MEALSKASHGGILGVAQTDLSLSDALFHKKLKADKVHKLSDI